MVFYVLIKYIALFTLPGTYLQYMYCTSTIFQTEEPKAFDQHLPPITPDDVTMLRNEVPELAQDLQ